jgi:hypothetical protein
MRGRYLDTRETAPSAHYMKNLYLPVPPSPSAPDGTDIVQLFVIVRSMNN